MEDKKYQRSPAVEILIKDLLKGTVIIDSAENRSYFLTAEHNQIQRINNIAIILYKEIIGTMTNFLLDDGTGKIMLRFFEEHKIIPMLNVGDCVLVLGKVREYSQEKYISPEIVRKSDYLWLKVRALQLNRTKNKIIDSSIPTNQALEVERISPSLNQMEGLNNNNSGAGVDVVEEILDSLPHEKITQLIKELDKGEGVWVEEILEKSLFKETEEMLQKMLERGDIFQIMPGKIKVL